MKSFDASPRGVSLKRNSSELENQFATLWDAIGGPELVREYRGKVPVENIARLAPLAS